MARGKRAEETEGGGAPGWMVTYGDMMSLLLCFFVLLISFSTIHEEDFKKAIASLKGALGVLPSQISLIDLLDRPTQIETFQDVAATIERYIRVRGRQKDIKVEYTEQGLKLVMQNPVLFDSGEAVLKPEAVPILRDITGILKELEGNFMSVEGHTDNVPIHTTEFPSNLELSSARGLTVARFLIDKGKLDYNTVSMAGWGKTQPVAPNNSPENRRKNRRVEIIVFREKPTRSLSRITTPGAD